ncbi:tetratricopeptide repeat protein [Nocardia sp. NEAU-G5]|uniref:Tetratricopeptide repeat protein n=1 Tax=Nocardia albiluteola TaxID=2842303 RepID=A0ABS6AXB3_9NOCA|nr:tetratricopeptide repeat protein [Nocardia albiluteola]MBU3062706.1 tetratricopeptide repeat protein [Nocardia albiluteola]MBU3065460.1 tetratricopeptide repeat protein [Nocardia albiluteola]
MDEVAETDGSDQPQAAPPESDGRELLQAGATAYGNGDATGALRIFEDAARTTSGRIRLAAMVNAASMADGLGEHRRAVSWFRTALAEMPGDAGAMRPTALLNMSQALQHLGDLDGAQEALNRARSLLTDDPEQGTLRVACLLSCTAVAIHRQHWVDAIDLATESLDTARYFAPHLAGHPLMNLAAAYFETGRGELALDFARQALDAFGAAQDANGVAETQQNLALMHIRSGRPQEAEPLLTASQAYFEGAGLGPRAGIGLKAQGFASEMRGAHARAYELYRRSLDQFTDSGAVLEAAEARIRVATVAFSLGRHDEAGRLFGESFRVFADHGLGLHCAQVDFWHARLLESTLDDSRPDPPRLVEALWLAVPSALAIDAVRHIFPGGEQRHRWHRELAEPAMRSAFRLAYRSGDARLVSDLIETQCAGATVKFTDQAPVGPADRWTALEPQEPPEALTGTLTMAAALAEVAAGEGVAIAPPPRLRYEPGGRIVLEEYIAEAERRYGRRIRDDRVLPV